jgi:Uma2 family endonuclease
LPSKISTSPTEGKAFEHSFDGIFTDKEMWLERIDQRRFKMQQVDNLKSKIQNPKSKIQNPKSIMVAIAPSPLLSTPVEGYVLLHDVSWETLETLDSLLDETGVRLSYLDGFLEIMSPMSAAHEEPKSTVSRLIEVYMREKQIRFYMMGSTTIGKKENRTRREPDESYNLGTKKPLPDLILEVTVTSGGINKLAIYYRLGIPEVWFWEDGVLSVYCLQPEGYEKRNISQLLPDLDLDLLAHYSRMADQFDAINEFTQALRQA